ncbi:MAG: SlyX family protein [Thiothrix sp.]|uniref:SlyX family protein n=1 Tax=Thiothrix sp. TaxID=1032 RepID=UPI002608623F|nr:SlyX family protein [Thiothrix sp.]MDD5393737.1 SlyX family protein [Thiothrix sp.]
MEARLEKLELLFMEQEQTLEALSHQVYLQHQEIRTALLEIERLNEKLKSLSPSAVGSQADETPPPHY